MRDLIQSFEREFSAIDTRSRQILSLLTEDQLYRRPRPSEHSLIPFSVGEFLLRSGAAVEQTFGGLTRRLWDDPFEWTLPEKLASIENVRSYLDEVAHTTASGLTLLQDDSDLIKMVQAPAGLVAIQTLLTQTISAANHYQGRAFAIFQVISDQQLPRI